MELLPYENLFDILLPLPYQQIICFCLSNWEYYNNIGQDNIFWASKAFRDLNVPVKEFNLTYLKGRKRYLELLAKIGGNCIPGSEKIIGVNECLVLASSRNDSI